MARDFGDSNSHDRDHPIVAAACSIQASLSEVADQSTWSMRDQDARDTTLLLTELEARVVELSRRVLCEADRRDVAADTGGTSTANWLAHTRPMRPSNWRKKKTPPATPQS